MSTTCAALGSPVRVAIIDALRTGPTRVTDLPRPNGISLAAVSKHARVLERAGLLRRRVDGRVHWLALDPRPLEAMRAWLDDAGRFWDGRLDALDDVLQGGTDAVSGTRSREDQSA